MPSKSRRQIETFKHRIRSIAYLINEIQDYAALQIGALTLKPQPIDMALMVEKTLKEFRQIMRNDIIFDSEVELSEAEYVQIDGVRSALTPFALSLFPSALPHL